MQHIYIGNNINCDVCLACCLLWPMYTHLHAFELIYKAFE